MKTIYLIEDQFNAPGRILAAFSSIDEAQKFFEFKGEDVVGIITMDLYASAREAVSKGA